MRTIALDLGARETSWCEVRNGVVTGRGVAHGLAALEPLLGAGTEPAQVGFEACRESLHVCDWLSARGHTPVMLDTTRVRQLGVGSHRRKNDRNDAECLAIGLERGYAAKAHVLSPLGRKLREALEVHRALTGARAEWVTHVRGLVAGRGLRLPSCAPEHFAENVRQVQLPVEIRELVEGLLSCIDEVQRRLAEVGVRIDGLLIAQEDVVVERLASVPGVSLMVAAAFISVIDEPQRFRRASEVVAYLGLCPSENSSGGKQRLGSITKRGNGHARAMLVQAAWCVLRSRNTKDPLVHWAHRVSARRGRMRAAVAVARRLARILWAMWRQGTFWDPQGLWREAAKDLQANAEQAAALVRIAQRQAESKLRKQRRVRERTLAAKTESVA
jgi:transposase